MYFTSFIGDAIGIPLRLTLSLLSCFSLGIVQLTRAAPTMKPSIIAEQYPRCRFQRPQIFFPASDSHTSITIIHVQPNNTEVHKAMPKRLYTPRITLLLCIHVDPSGILCYGTTMVLLFVHLVRRSGAKKNWRIFFLSCLFQRKNVGILISTWTSFSN